MTPFEPNCQHTPGSRTSEAPMTDWLLTIEADHMGLCWASTVRGTLTRETLARQTLTGSRNVLWFELNWYLGAI